MGILHGLLSLVKRKYDWYFKHGPQNWLHYSEYVKAMKNEIKEMEEELKLHNTVYLEDECGDILWDYLNIIYTLKKE